MLGLTLDMTTKSVQNVQRRRGSSPLARTFSLVRKARSARRRLKRRETCSWGMEPYTQLASSLPPRNASPRVRSVGRGGYFSFSD